MFPAFVELKGRPVLVIGSGAVAAHKAEVLRGFGAEVRLTGGAKAAAPDVMADTEGAAPSGPPVLVVIATGEREKNRKLAETWKAKCALVNVVDDPAACTFTFGAMACAGEVVVGVSTNGRSPVAAQWLRDRIRPLISERFLRAVKKMGEIRRKILSGCAEAPRPLERKAFFREEFKRCIAGED